MKLSSITASHGGRLALVAIPVAIVSTVLMAGVAQGAVPVAFTVSGQTFKISASSLDGQDFSQYQGSVTQPDGTQLPVAIANIGQANLSNLCQSVVADTPLGKVGLVIHAGGGGVPATASDLQIGMTDLKGDAKFTNIRIGVDAGSVITDAKGTSGEFAQDASGVTITDLQQTALSTTAGVFNLRGLHLQVTDGKTECF